MTKNVLLDCFVQNLEKERLNLGMTQAEFASKLEISVSTYKNIISRRTDKIDIMIAMQIYKLTGHFLYELFGNDNPEMECLKKFRLLNNRQKAYISGKIDFELEMMSHEQDSENMLDVLVLTGNMEDGMVLDSANEERTVRNILRNMVNACIVAFALLPTTLILCMSEMISWEFQRNLRVTVTPVS